MQWYYEKDGQSAGPVSDNDFRALVFRGQVTRQTLVWRQGLEKWTAYGRLPSGAAPGGKTLLRLSTPAHPVECAKCAKTFDMKEMTEVKGAYVCPDCQAASTDQPPSQEPSPDEVVFKGYAGFQTS